MWILMAVCEVCEASLNFISRSSILMSFTDITVGYFEVLALSCWKFHV